MTKSLSISVGQHSDAGRKPINQDFYGAYMPKEPLLSGKGIAVAIADGISSSNVSQIASETAVTGFLHDYYCTSDAWSVRNSAQKVLKATNSWLYSQTRRSPHRYNKDKGYICTFSGLVIKSATAHLFHCGDSRIYHLTRHGLEKLTTDHRHVVSEETSYLTRALGIHDSIEMDYSSRPVDEGDYFILSTDGIHEFVPDSDLIRHIKDAADDLDTVAKSIADLALNSGSTDNVTIQILRIDQLPALSIGELSQQLDSLPLPPKLEPRMLFDGYRIIREVHISSRSHVYLAEDSESGEQVAIKTPSTELQGDKDYLENLLLEDWIAKRISNPHVLKAIPALRKRHYLYTVTEYIDGQSLSQWMIDNPQPSIEEVRSIIDQVAKGLQAFHRQEMIHQDLRPQNIMIDSAGTVRIIDFGSTRVAGISEIRPGNEGIVGTMQYSAPEFFTGDMVSSRADLFSLGVITYQMLSGEFPYGLKVSNARSRADLRKLRYRPLTEQQPPIADWLDGAIHKAVSIPALKRYHEVSEFTYDLRTPNKTFVRSASQPLLERNPVAFWQGLSLILFLIVIWQALP